MINYSELGEKNINKPKNAPIIVIDSGLGGVLCAKKIFEDMPSENVILYTDHLFLPYGNKSKREIEKRASDIFKNLKKLNPKAIVIACNTLDSLAGDTLDTIAGNIPIFHVVNVTALKGIKASKTKQVGLLATPATINSHSYMHAIVGYDHRTNLYGVECPDLAVAIETNTNLKEEIQSSVLIFKEIEIDTLILGCTHYTKITPLIQKLFPDIQLIDSTMILATSVVEGLRAKELHAKASLGKFLVISSSTDVQYYEMLEKNLRNIEYIVMDENENSDH